VKQRGDARGMFLYKGKTLEEWLRYPREKSVRHGYLATSFAGLQVSSIMVDRSLPSLRRRDAGAPTGGPRRLFFGSGDG
jgi:hypothetical protein